MMLVLWTEKQATHANQIANVMYAPFHAPIFRLLSADFCIRPLILLGGGGGLRSLLLRTLEDGQGKHKAAFNPAVLIFIWSTWTKLSAFSTPQKFCALLVLSHHFWLWFRMCPISCVCVCSDLGCWFKAISSSASTIHYQFPSTVITSGLSPLRWARYKWML